MTIPIPTVLALAGTAMIAIAIFGPHRLGGSTEREETEPLPKPASVRAAIDTVSVRWPALVDPAAVGVDPAGRIDLAEALGSLRSAWAEGVLLQAYDTEPDPLVRMVIDSALQSTRSLVT